MRTTKIEWTQTTWNVTTGCTKISAGCKHCYAEKMAKRLNAMGNKKYRNSFQLTLHPETLNEPYRWKAPRIVFVNSMSDLFHERIPIEYIQRVFKVMNENPKHTFQVLTKRAERLFEYANLLNWTENIWVGVTVENEDVTYRIDKLRKVNASVRFISMEPLLSEISTIDLSNIEWVIVGGESGPGARPMKPEWVIRIKEDCERQQTPFFFKQWGGINKKKTGRELEGKTWDEMPDALYI